ncbi:MAG: tRNA uridine-5-carboxymethylaminomethyl(34) synthesis GTPase MnmE [Mesorhizobium sp.]
MTDTIFALSSGPLPAGVALIRISGPQVRDALLALTGGVPQPRVANVCALKAVDGSVIDRGLAVYFAGPASFTGEDIAELNLHGSRAVVARMLKELAEMPGLRFAEQGEFAKRAFLNGKMDLTEAEGLADLIEAETEAQRRFAMVSSTGAQRALYSGWRTRLTHARAMLEAELDFSDQEDVPGSVSDAISADLEELSVEMSEHVSGFKRAEILREGFDVVIIGPPNAGKSSLLNALARREVAIVSDEPGTTRDLIEVSLDLGGVKVRVTDTAGLRDEAGKVEAIGIERARKRASEADLVLQLRDLTQPDEMVAMDGVLVVGSKSDLVDTTDVGGMHISARTGEGIASLIDEIERRACAAAGHSGDILPAQIRHVEYLNWAIVHIEDAISGFDGQTELQAEALRMASDQLGRITGQVDVEDILDVIFSRFCIGK